MVLVKIDYATLIGYAYLNIPGSILLYTVRGDNVFRVTTPLSGGNLLAGYVFEIVDDVSETQFLSDIVGAAPAKVVDISLS